MTNTLWIYWEMPKGQTELPPHIALCRKSMEIHMSGGELQLVTPDNLQRFLPNISSKIFDLAITPKGRIERLFRGHRKRRAIAQRADVIRAFLLERYGGFYIDSDAILLGKLDRYFSLLDRYDFCAVRRESFGRSHVSVGFMGSRAHGTVISEYTEALEARIAKSLDIEWNELGAALLTPIFDRHTDSVYAIPERELQPVTFEVADSKFPDESIELRDILAEDARVFMLYSGPFKSSLRGADMEALYRGSMLISKAFRAGIPEEAFQELLATRRS